MSTPSPSAGPGPAPSCGSHPHHRADATPCCTSLMRQRVPADAAGTLAQAFKALGVPIRLQLMSMIASAPSGEVCVCDLTPAFTISVTTISHHLKVLREAGLVDAERRASWVYYRARPELIRQLSALLDVDQHAAA